MKKSFIALFALALCANMHAQKLPNYGSTRAALDNLFESKVPTLRYDTSISADSMDVWRQKMSEGMKRIMNHPDSPAKAEELISSAKRNGYTIQRWRSWPLPNGPVHYYVLIPDNVKLDKSTPAALCIPGFGQTKELLAGEKAGNYTLEGEAAPEPTKNAMALSYVNDGIVAFVVDNPCFGELSDNGFNDFLASSRLLLEMGWNYLGLTSWQDKVVLDAMKRHDAVDNSRIIVSGFSLGTEPLMVLGLLDPSIFAFVYNDFLCSTRERVIVMDAPYADGSRPLPNTIEHLIPEFLTQFDFPDILAALSPRPLICTEGGLDRDFLMVADAYAKAGARDNFQWHHYPKFADPANRELQPTDTIPRCIDRATFFRLANVDPPSHYFKSHLIMPWVKNILDKNK